MAGYRYFTPASMHDMMLHFLCFFCHAVEDRAEVPRNEPVDVMDKGKNTYPSLVLSK